MDPFFLPLVLAGRLGAFCDRYPELAIEFLTSEHVGDLVRAASTLPSASVSRVFRRSSHAS
jgi:DNA-binding transcriptional LysR family regulator